MSYRNILHEKDSHVITITINRPEVHNCINWETAKELQRACRAIHKHRDLAYSESNSYRTLTVIA